MIAWRKILYAIGVLLISLQGLSLNMSTRARGALLYMNYCSGCHSMQGLSWAQMSAELNVNQNSTLESPFKITARDFNKTWPHAGLSQEDTKNWFGKIPPDLSLSARLHTTRWLKEYLTGFYPDQTRLFGTNNKVFPDVNMPNILSSLQNQVDEKTFEGMVTDIVNFLEYAADPSLLIRLRLGFFVVGFLIIFCLLFKIRMSR